MYLDTNKAYNKHVETIKHRNNVRLIFGTVTSTVTNYMVLVQLLINM